MGVANYIIGNYSTIVALTWEHLYLVCLPVGAAILTGVPIGIFITKNQAIADRVIYLAAVIITIPSIALFGFMVPILSTIDQGIGFWPAAVAIFLYAQLPIIRNTYTAINNIDPALREAARGMGMDTMRRLAWVEIPLATPIILAGVRTAVVMNIAVATIAVYIGAGGLGTIINEGISSTDRTKLLVGALMVSLLAILADSLFYLIQRALTPKGILKHD